MPAACVTPGCQVRRRPTGLRGGEPQRFRLAGMIINNRINSVSNSEPYFVYAYTVFSDRDP
jgi:hypothetical protein